MVKPTEDFIDSFVEKLLELKKHSFIAEQQAAFFQEVKENLEPGTIIVGGNFSENYHFVVQDAAQGYHWANDQVTIHPFIVYHKLGDELKSLSIAMISDELNHDTNAVWSFQKVLMDHLKSENIQMKKVIYFSDGCFAQYKNKKNFTNLIHHENNFNVPAEWHFFATAHGKGAFFILVKIRHAF